MQVAIRSPFRREKGGLLVVDLPPKGAPLARTIRHVKRETISPWPTGLHPANFSRLGAHTGDISASARIRSASIGRCFSSRVYIHFFLTLECSTTARPEPVCRVIHCDKVSWHQYFAPMPRAPSRSTHSFEVRIECDDLRIKTPSAKLSMIWTVYGG